MDDPNKIYDNLRQLLTELQKVKDLNNLANEYKVISANLVLSLQDYLNESRKFSGSFNEYLLQNNKSLDATKGVLDKAVNSINQTIRTFGVADGKLDGNVSALNEQLSQVKEQILKLETLYNGCLTLEHQIKEDAESYTLTMVNRIIDENNNLIKTINSLLPKLIEEISVANVPVIESINSFNGKLESIKENSMHTENSIQSYSEQILGKMISLRDLVSQSDEAIINYQKKLLEEHQSISGEVDLLRKELLETNENRFGAINEWNHSFELQIKTVDERICAELINIVSMIEQRGVMLKQYNMQMQDSHKELIGCFDVVSGELENQKLHFEELAQSSVKNNDACMKKHSDKILGGLDSVQKMQKFIMFLLVVIIALAGILIFK